MDVIEHPRTRPPPRRGWKLVVSLCVVAALAGGGYCYWKMRPAPQTAARQAPAVPVTVADAASRTVPIFLDGLGTVSASNTVSIRSQITGTLQKVNFTEGQEVHQGDVLAMIDPRPLEAALTQATAKKAQDQAQLVSAQKDLARFSDLAKRDFATQQSVDQQQAKVDQLKAMIDADQGAIENAQTQLSYATITAPFDGTRRLPSGRCRQHRPPDRRAAVDGADADQALDGDLHAAAEKSRRGARGDAARQGRRARLRSRWAERTGDRRACC